MAIAVLSIFGLSWLYLSWFIFRNYRKRKARNFEYKQKQIAYHIRYAHQLRQMAFELLDPDFMDYSNQELDKADKIIETIDTAPITFL